MNYFDDIEIFSFKEFDLTMRYNPKKHHLPIFSGNGILSIDKPAGWTSFDVVNFLRNRYNIPKVGHCGTLDPAATGLLVIVLGGYTKFSDKLMASDKVYQCTLRLGVETDSYDLDGEVIAEKEVNVTEEELLETLKSFEGDQMQMPPMVSAVKVGGKKLYELARKGVEIEREARPHPHQRHQGGKSGAPRLRIYSGVLQRNLCPLPLPRCGRQAGLRRHSCGAQKSPQRQL